MPVRGPIVQRHCWLPSHSLIPLALARKSPDARCPPGVDQLRRQAPEPATDPDHRYSDGAGRPAAVQPTAIRSTAALLHLKITRWARPWPQIPIPVRQRSKVPENRICAGIPLRLFTR